MSMEKKAKKELNIFAVFFKLLPVCFRVSPIATVLSIVVNAVHGVSWGVVTLCTQRLLDSALGFAGGNILLQGVLVSLAFLALAHAAGAVLNGVANFFPGLLFPKISGTLSLKVHEKMARLSPVEFEKTETLDHINKAVEGTSDAVVFVFIISVIFTFYLPYFCFMAWYLWNLKPLLVLALAAAFIPTALTQFLRANVFSKLEDASAPIRREYEYYEQCMAGREYFKETRILGAFSYFKKLYTDCLVLLNRIKFKHELKANGAELAMKILTLASYLGVIYLLFDALIKREISAGAFAAVYASMGQLFGIMNEVICNHIGNAARQFGKIRNYLSFFDLGERGGADMVVPKTGGIGLENISFTYPGVEKKAVDSVSFTIKDGETIAIVGENGSGKSTLVRLITGLYLPSQGAVFIGGVNTAAASMKSLFADTSAVFQKYQRYQMSLRENVGISQGGGGEGVFARACAEAGVEMGQFPNGADTMLSREFDGIDLSGGQWQRVAIARGFYRTHNLIVLDEPTAAIDPIEETKTYNRFAEIARDKTAIIVTHRMGSVRLADRILVMKDGQIAEAGVHGELLKAGGEYARLYKSQEQWYA